MSNEQQLFHDQHVDVPQEEIIDELMDISDETFVKSEVDKDDNERDGFDSEVESDSWVINDESESDSWVINDESDNIDEIEKQIVTELEPDKGTTFAKQSMMSYYLSLTLKSFLIWWATKFNVSRTALDILLTFLNQNNADIPRSSRTLLKCPRETHLVSVPPGNYVHLGVINALTSNSELNLTLIHNNVLELEINYDGANSVSSSKETIWPIQGYIVGQSMLPMLIGIYQGKNS